MHDTFGSARSDKQPSAHPRETHFLRFVIPFHPLGVSLILCPERLPGSDWGNQNNATAIAVCFLLATRYGCGIWDGPRRATSLALLHAQLTYLHLGELLPHEIPPRNPEDELSQRYLKIVPHPHASALPQIIPLDSHIPPPALNIAPSPRTRSAFAPFRTEADFEFVETVVDLQASRPQIGKLLTRVTNNWIAAEARDILQQHDLSPTSVTYQSVADVEKSMELARKYTIQFRESTITASLRGEERTFKFLYRDVWEFIVSLVEDPTLASDIMWHSVTKTLHDERGEQHVIDQPNTASDWKAVDDQLPDANPYQHCWVPVHIWLDEGRVTHNITKYPILVRALFLPDWIRNASGNGGGMLVGYMLEDPDPGNGSDEDEEFAQFVREIYQGVLDLAFASCRVRARDGDIVRCGDGIFRVLHPGLGIGSMDGKEAARFTACKSHNANFPCPKCLVHKSELSDITTTTFKLRTTERMRKVLAKARIAPNATARRKILKDNGLHDVEHFAWNIAFSDPYRALTYDTLHSDDLGKWGAHLWELLLAVVATIDDGPRRLDKFMRDFPRWQSLKHFNNVTGTHFADGQSFFDILKSILPCITQILPPRSVLVRCIRAYLKYRMMIGMKCMTEERLQLLRVYVREYQECCSQVAKVHGKKFDFYKQHFTSHAESDIRAKGTLNHASTRPGEGFIQEAAEAYSQTSKKNVDAQMTRIDENKEAVAQIRMAVNHDKAAARHAEEEGKQQTSPLTKLARIDAGKSWAFGSPSSGLVTSHQIETGRQEDVGFHDFDMRLRLFLLQLFPDELVLSHHTYQLGYIRYQSREDWRELQDFVRCNPYFQGGPRFDSVLVNYDSPDLEFGRLLALVRCILPSGRTVDFAMLQCFTRSSWKPRTSWDGARIYKAGREVRFVLMDYIVRGALLAPAFGQAQHDLHYLVDSVDSDMFLRAISNSI
ncbi:hypothetical protein HDZ31DRAFT_46862 [Schizophyllum fasciatum]